MKKGKANKCFLVLACMAVVAPVGIGVAQQATPTNGVAEQSVASSSSGTRYGLFDWLDHRSQYGQFVFPEPFLVDDSDLEVDEFRLDLVHTEGNHLHHNEGTVEVEKGFGLLTLELEVPYERDNEDGQVSKGFANIDVGARYPLYQFVSPSGFVDTTFGVAMEIGIPTQSSVSKNAEVVPKFFNDLKVGNFTLQSILGYSTLFGGGDEGGLQTFEYGFVFGYTIPHKQLRLPGVEQVIPVFELIGETELNKDDPGHNSLLGNAAIRFNLKSIGRVQPRPGVGFLFPIDKGAREDQQWGVVVSLVFEY